jgi:hypothetical protein
MNTKAVGPWLPSTADRLAFLRNLNNGPGLMPGGLGACAPKHPLGISPRLAALKERFLWLPFGYFNPPWRQQPFTRWTV